MKLYIKNKLISVGGSSKVLDENEKPVYKVKGKVFSITKKKKIMDMEGNKLYTVRNKFWRWLMNSALIYDANGDKVAKVSQKFSFAKKKFVVQGYKDEIKIESNFVGLNYSIYKNEEILGTLKKEFFALTDSFALDIEKEEDAPLFVAFVIAIDNIHDKNMADND